MKNFIKRNLVLILGIALPLILILVFASVRLLSEFVDPPRYKPVFAVQTFYGNIKPFKFTVGVDGKLAVDFKVTPDNDQQRTWAYQAHIIVYDPVMDSAEIYEITSPENFEAGKIYSVKVPEGLENWNILPQRLAPDGYVVKPYDRSRGNLFSELFGYNMSYNTRFVLTKNGRNYPITTEGIYYGEFTSIGWLPIEGDGGD